MVANSSCRQSSLEPGALVHGFQSRAILGLSIPHLKLAAAAVARGCCTESSIAIWDTIPHGTPQRPAQLAASRSLFLPPSFSRLGRDNSNLTHASPAFGRLPHRDRTFLSQHAGHPTRQQEYSLRSNVWFP